MRSLHRWAIALAFLLILAAQPQARAEPAYPGPYATEVIRVIDGDTVWMRVALWPDITLEVAVRLRGIDAPELGDPGGLAARNHLQALLQTGAVHLFNPRPGKYARRIIADLRLPDRRDVAQALIQAGHAARLAP